MKAGKPSESVLSRSVLKQLNKDAKGPVSRMKQLDYGSYLIKDGGGDKRAVLSSQTITYPVSIAAKIVTQSALNNIYCAGATADGIMLNILFPTEGAEQDLRAIVKEAQEIALAENAAVLGGHTEIVSGIKQPIITVTASGTVAADRLVTSDGAKPGMDLVVTKQVGLAGTAILVERHMDLLRERYTQPFLDLAYAFYGSMSVEKEAKIALEHEAAAMHDVSYGGIYGALWELCDRANIGLEVDLKAIPIKQETVEICEKLDVNPYKLYGSGSLLVASKRGEELVEALAAQGIAAAVIGHTTEGKDRILFTGEEKRFLETTQTDELFRKGK